MKEFSTETITIDDKEYTLFLNRKGLVSWENITKLNKTAKKIQEKHSKLIKEFEDDEPIEIKDGDNPFDFVDDEQIQELDEDMAKIRDMYAKFYWIALYENHKLPLSEVKEIFAKAEEIYGLEQLAELSQQMIQDINTDKVGNTQTKKLTALRPTK